jgi:3-phosphoshikimate 1-carboxyvinyltransferase
MHMKFKKKLNLTPNHFTINTIPGDKSISHRAIIIGSIASNTSKFSNFLMSEDCKNTISIFKHLGVSIDTSNSTISVSGVGLKGLKAPKTRLNVGNSGTSIRLITGLLAVQNFNSIISGDTSIQARPMKRIITPLTQMGAKITGIHNKNNDTCPPLTITAENSLNPITYTLPIASAQVKSALLLAGLFIPGKTTITEPTVCRNHTELMLKAYNAKISTQNTHINLEGNHELKNPFSKTIKIPSDFSSAAFFIVLGLIVPNLEITLKNIGINPTRAGLLDILKDMGAHINLNNQTNDIEPTADIHIKSSHLKNITIPISAIANIIDEIPILAVAAMFASGTMKLTNAKELRFKESDRIQKIVELVTQFGGSIIEHDDGFEINGGITPIKHIPTITTHYDHRIAMSAIIASIATKTSCEIDSLDCITTSFPNFLEIIKHL